MKLKIIVANSCGFCAGVERAIKIVNKTLEEHSSPVFVLHELVHNEYVIDELKNKGVMFTEDLQDVPPNKPLIFSAHGVAKDIENSANSAIENVIDATCPIVKKIHRKAEELDKLNYKIILIGDKQHSEVIGISGYINHEVFIVKNIDDVKSLPAFNNEKVAYLTQTTLSQDDIKDILIELKLKYPNIIGDSNICYATKERQDAVKDLKDKCDLIIIIGSKTSSNSNRLYEIAKTFCKNSFLINDKADLANIAEIQNANTIGISAGASTPEYLITETVDYLKKL